MSVVCLILIKQKLKNPHSPVRMYSEKNLIHHLLSISQWTSVWFITQVTALCFNQHSNLGFCSGFSHRVPGLHWVIQGQIVTSAHEDANRHQQGFQDEIYISFTNALSTFFKVGYEVMLVAFSGTKFRWWALF